jgi:hypothetical protein
MTGQSRDIYLYSTRHPLDYPAKPDNDRREKLNPSVKLENDRKEVISISFQAGE